MYCEPTKHQHKFINFKLYHPDEFMLYHTLIVATFPSWSNEWV